MGNKTAFMNNISTISTQNSKTHKTEKKVVLLWLETPISAPDTALHFALHNVTVKI